jgi:acetylornithine deacetylase/succinyl-diaminopimelate desuccinylase-like protein
VLESATEVVHRLVQGLARKGLEEAVAGICEGLGEVKATINETAPASVSDWEPEMAEMFQRAAEQGVGRPVAIVPNWCSGATDAHYVRKVGTPVYGFQLIHPDANAQRLGIHCIDESIEASMLLPCALSLAHLAVEFLQS